MSAAADLEREIVDQAAHVANVAEAIRAGKYEATRERGALLDSRRVVAVRGLVEQVEHLRHLVALADAEVNARR